MKITEKLLFSSPHIFFFPNLNLIFNANIQKKFDTWNVNFQKPIYGYTNVHSSARSPHFLMENMGHDVFSNKKT